MTYIPEVLRRQVYERAKGRCEYCFIGELLSIKPHEIDHIYAEKHGGVTVIDNLCLSCLDWNRYEGSDLCSLDNLTAIITSLFHPRQDDWYNHFRLDGVVIEPLTAIGRVTVRLLR